MTDYQFPQCWAIEPARLTMLQALHEAHLRDAVEQFASPASAIQARAGGAGRDLSPQLHGIHNGVAVVPIRGVLTPRTSWLGGFVETTALDAFTRALRAAAADPQAKALLLVIDSPGGAVAGVQAAARAVRAFRGTKPIGAFIEDTAASSAYWIGSAVDPGSFWISSDTTQVGSIGVVATHTDISKREQARGLVTTEIVAGKFKRIASELRPLDDAGRAAMQEQVDHVYRAFIADVAAHRGVSTQRVLADMADGRVFLGQNAVRAGLVDGIATIEDAIAQLSARARGRAAPAAARGASAARTTAPAPAGVHVRATAAAATEPVAALTPAPPVRPAAPCGWHGLAMTADKLDTAARAHQAQHGGTYLDALRALVAQGQRQPEFA
jgi:signal peptide peptidase SppA